MLEINQQTLLDLQDNRTSLGIEFGSTRIKAVLTDSTFAPIASGSYEWENKLEDGYWTYSLEEIWNGIQTSYKELVKDVDAKFGVQLTSVGSIGISAMMHGYMAFDKEDSLLVPFRTWRNSTTGQAAEELTKIFNFNVPQRWSVAHYYQAILNNEEHIKQVDFLTTLAGYVHWKLTGEKVLGIGDASGMFPIDSEKNDYDENMLKNFNELAQKKNIDGDIKDLLPKVLCAGEEAGRLTDEGAKLLDPTGQLKAGSPLCPPEGDAGTGMVATNSVAQKTGNISVGTSAFAMIVLEHALSKVYPEIDMVTTPSGKPVAMVHTNNCSSDINAWMHLFKEFTSLLDLDVSDGQLFSLLFKEALKADADCGGLLSYGYFSGENITGLNEGRPVFVREQNSNFTLANFMRTHLSSAFGALRIGMEILKDEDIQIEHLVGHGGIFKTPEVGQRILSAAMEAPITVMETAGEGGAWGIALLAAYLGNAKELSLADFLEKKVFADTKGLTLEATSDERKGYAGFIGRYKAGLEVEKAAVNHLK